MIANGPTQIFLDVIGRLSQLVIQRNVALEWLVAQRVPINPEHN